ncbi:unnamed protein product [Ostreobium quekettii]|uniref:Enoyl-CoA hydratase n=1 Tax=Ostreobium quekettii TaxID=121088 RepID=A0A8S1J4T1_9CHLO|nr:unnamed protein product [Ostreobium quekettii]|eukprot:evm.model.scf_211.7 EVM.evm.TU.scf_211.7   scf_211:59807-61521(-)
MFSPSAGALAALLRSPVRRLCRRLSSAPPTGELVRCDFGTPTAVVSFEGHARRNAMGRQTVDELRTCVAALRWQADLRCIVFRSGVPGVFCAGADLKERANMDEEEVREFVSTIREAVDGVAQLQMPTIALIDGPAFGGGAELAIACDFRVGTPTAKLAFPEVRLGIIPGAGGTQRLPRIVGESKAKQLILLGTVVQANEAKQLGLLDYVGSDAEDHVRALATTLAENAPLALRAAKTAVDHAADVDMQNGLIFEGECYDRVLYTRDRKEGLKAFLEKRKPEFTGS